MNQTSKMMANAQLKSFSTQIVFLAYQLLKYQSFENQILSLEKIGDFGVEGEEAKIVELKNADHPLNNPLSNNSVSLWKTIYNWSYYFYVENIQNIGQYSLLLYVNSKNECKADLADMLANCKNNKQFLEIIKKLKDSGLISSQANEKTIGEIDLLYTKRPKTVQHYISLLCSKELYGFFEKVSYQFQYEKSSEDYFDKLKNLIKALYGCSDDVMADELAEKFLGWTHRKVVELQSNNQLILIKSCAVKEFSENNIGPLLNVDKYKMHSSLKPEQESIEEEVLKKPQYIRQLEIIDGSNEELRDAAYYYLKLKLERNNWVKSGYLENINDPKYVVYQEDIKRSWNIINSNHKSVKDDIARGKKVYNECLDKNVDKLDGIKLENSVARGVVQELAEIDMQSNVSIGWHPNYKSILAEEKDDE